MKKNKKLPSIFRKKYSQKKLQRKVLKRIFINEDKKFIKSLYVQEESQNPKKPGKFYIPNDKEFSKEDFKRVKQIGKQVKKQRGRVRFVPLVAVVGFIVVIICLFIATKNIFLTKITKNIFESQFEAKCDIGRMELNILDSSFIVKDFGIADKNQPMKNLFSFDSLVVDFDLVQLLKAKFVADEMSIENMAVGSDRKTNGTLSQGQLNKIKAKKAKKAEKMQKLNEQKVKVQKSFVAATDKVKNNINDSIIEVFETFNPKNILESCYSQMLTPDMAKKIQDETVILINKWKTTPDRVMAQVQNVQHSVEDIMYFDYNSIQNDPRKIKDMLETFDAGLKTLGGVKTETENILSEMESDFKHVGGLTIEVKDSIIHDIDVTNNELNKLKSFRLPSGQEFISSTIDIYGHELLGKYYPYVKQGLDFVVSMKDKQMPEKIKKKEEKPEKKEIKRATGRDINFVRDRNPKFWIKKIYASGFNMALDISNLANDMNKTDLPTEALFTFKYHDVLHSGKLVVDIRNNTTNPLVYTEYDCEGTSFVHADNIPGVPQIKTNADYMCNAKVIENEAFVLSGNANLYNLELTTPVFEPTYIWDIYNSVLSHFDSAKVGLEIAFDFNKGLILRASSDLDEKIAQALMKEINIRLMEIKNKLEADLSAMLKGYIDKAQVVVDDFRKLEAKVSDAVNELKDMENKLKNKQNEIKNKFDAAGKQVEDRLKAESQKVQDDLAKKAEAAKIEREKKSEERRKAAEEELKRKNEEMKKAGQEAAGEALKGIFGGLKRP